jgi:urease accessory protein
MHDAALLNLLNLASPALPIGSYAWSQGLESAVERGWVGDERELLAWLEGVLEHGLCRLDAPLVVRCHDALARGDGASFQAWAALGLACRESRELQDEDSQTGAALLRLLTQLEPERASVWEAHRAQPIGLPAAFALAGRHWGIPRRETALGLLWSWAENQVAAGIKLIPLGQTAGQRVLLQLRTGLPAHLDRALALPDEAIGSALPGLAVASALHETQYCRLFRS